MDEFNDSFIEVPCQHSVSNSDSGIVTSRNSEEGSFSQAAHSNIEAKKLNSSEAIEMSDIKQSILNLGSTSTVEYETRDGTARQGVDYEHQHGCLVRKFFVIFDYI